MRIFNLIKVDIKFLFHRKGGEDILAVFYKFYVYTKIYVIVWLNQKTYTDVLRGQYLTPIITRLNINKIK